MFIKLISLMFIFNEDKIFEDKGPCIARSTFLDNIIGSSVNCKNSFSSTDFLEWE